MTTPQPNEPEQNSPTEAPSILGVDRPDPELPLPPSLPAEPRSQDEPTEGTPEPIEAPEAAQRPEPPADYEDLLALKKELEDDEGLREAVRNYYTNRGTQKEPDNQTQGPDVAKQVKELTNVVQTLFARLQVSEFSREHQDFEQYRPDVAKLIAKHPTMSLQDAYEYVKQTRGHASVPQVQKSPPVPAEGKQIAAEPNRSFEQLIAEKSRRLKPGASSVEFFDDALAEAIRRHS